MADANDDTPEGWGVRQKPALIAGLATPVLLLIALLVAGWFYDRDLRPKTQQPIVSFPAPGLETFVHDGVQDPQRPAGPATPLPAIEQAKRSVVSGGLVGWTSRR